MIVKIRKGASRGVSSEAIRRRILNVEGWWVKCVPPFSRSVMNIVIDDGSPLRVDSSSITEIINDERVNYQYCSYCGHSHKIGIDVCEHCGKTKEYFEPLMLNDISMSMSDVVKSVFGI